MYISLLLTVFLGIVFYKLFTVLKTSSYRLPVLFDYLSFEKFPDLVSLILSKGQILTTYYNKAYSTMNELMYLSLFAAVIMLTLVLYRYYKKKPCLLNIRILLFLVITSFFVCIPLNDLTGGIASILTYTTVSYRFYFSTLLFPIIPAFVLYTYRLIHIKNLWVINLTILSILLSTFWYSQYISNRHNYYKNVMSLAYMFQKDIMKFNLSKKEIAFIGLLLETYEKSNNSNKPNFYYARPDIAFIIKFVYRKPVLYGKRGYMDYKERYVKHHDRDYHPILFKTPKNFPQYLPYR